MMREFKTERIINGTRFFSEGRLLAEIAMAEERGRVIGKENERERITKIIKARRKELAETYDCQADKNTEFANVLINAKHEMDGLLEEIRRRIK